MANLVKDPGWRDDDRPRVLIEAAEWSRRQALARLLDRHGYATASCPGPEGTDDRCPLAAGDDCRAVGEADVVIHTLRSSDPRNREVLRALQRRRPSPRVIVEVPESVGIARADDYEGCAVISVPMTWASLSDVLEQRE